MIRSRQFRIFSTLQRLHKYGIAVNLDHDHEILVDTLRSLEELARLIRKNSVAHIIHFSVYIALIFALQCRCVGNFEGGKGGLGALYILARLI